LPPFDDARPDGILSTSCQTCELSARPSWRCRVDTVAWRTKSRTWRMTYWSLPCDAESLSRARHSCKAPTGQLESMRPFSPAAPDAAERGRPALHWRTRCRGASSARTETTIAMSRALRCRSCRRLYAPPSCCWCLDSKNPSCAWRSDSAMSPYASAFRRSASTARSPVPPFRCPCTPSPARAGAAP
jgi:hypothetical protein